jgi:hypothetical protein
MNVRRSIIGVWCLVFGVSLLVFGVTGCIAPSPIAPGADPVVVVAERVQQSSLSAYEQLIGFEYSQRAILPKEFSRAVDDARAEFPAMWQASRKALKDYKAKAGVDASTVEHISAALSAAQTAFLNLRSDDPGQINELTRALLALLDATQQVTHP